MCRKYRNEYKFEFSDAPLGAPLLGPAPWTESKADLYELPWPSELFQAAKRPMPAQETSSDAQRGRELFQQKNYREACLYLEEEGKRGSASALCLIGRSYFQIKSTKLSAGNAYAFLCKAAFRGDKTAVQKIARNFTTTDYVAAWKLYAQAVQLKSCENEAAEMETEARKSKENIHKIWSAEDAMVRAAQLWKCSMENVDRANARTNESIMEVRNCFSMAIRYGNIDAICGVAMFYACLKDYVGECEWEFERISRQYYQLAAYLGHSYAMYRLAQYYDTVDLNVANNCYQQAARWTYEPAQRVCAQRGIW